MRRYLASLALVALLAGCASPQVATAPPRSTAIRVPLTAYGGVLTVNVCIAHVCNIPFVIDSGSADVAVTPGIFRAMVKGGHVTDADLIDTKKYSTASGVIEGIRFVMPPMSIGGRTVYGVIGSVNKGATHLLLGQSFLRRFKFFAIDPHAGVLVLG